MSDPIEYTLADVHGLLEQLAADRQARTDRAAPRLPLPPAPADTVPRPRSARPELDLTAMIERIGRAVDAQQPRQRGPMAAAPFTTGRVEAVNLQPRTEPAASNHPYLRAAPRPDPAPRPRGRGPFAWLRGLFNRRSS